MQTITKLLISVSLSAALTACNGVNPEGVEVVDSAAPSGEVQSELSKPRTYRVTVKNVTAANAISPPLVIAQTNEFRLFEVGAAASAGLAKVAETGGTDVLESELKELDGARVVVKAAGGPIAAGQSRTIDVVLPAGSKARRLNLVAMIGKSNDSFVSRAESIDLSLADYGQVVVSLTNFDAGSEQNTGNVEDFGPGGHPVAEAEGMISYDRGLNARGNAPDIIGWGSTVGIVRIERL